MTDSNIIQQDKPVPITPFLPLLLTANAATGSPFRRNRVMDAVVAYYCDFSYNGTNESIHYNDFRYSFKSVLSASVKAWDFS
jgi:hypothetical protein